MTELEYIADPLPRFMLALCVWREARGESQLGRILVAQTVANRANDVARRWPTTITGVILQPKQFSAFNADDPNALKFPPENDADWLDCWSVAGMVLSAIRSVTTANHYHVKGLKPAWADASKIVASEGNHVFYRL